MKREQTGHIYRRGTFWILRYRETVNIAGTLQTKQRAKPLCPVSETHKTKRAVWKDANVQAEIDRILAPLNQHRQNPENLVSMAGFIEDVYLPHVKAYLRPSTAKGYADVWVDHLKRLVGTMLLREVRTCNVQRWLETIAAEDRTANGAPLRRETLKRIKSTLSGIFKHAKQQGYFDGENPVRDSQVPQAPAGQVTHAYSLAEINRMLSVVLSPMASTILAVAAYTGARRGEIEGLRWENWHDGAIHVSQSVWNGRTNKPKTDASAAPITVIPSLAEKLLRYRLYLGSPKSGPMFPGARDGKRVNLNNVLNREIKPVLKRCAVCGKIQAEHIKSDHDYRRDERLPEWRGWHAFRRGLATNLHDLGVADKTIQAILRHSNVAVTQKCYIKTLPAQSVAAMNMLESALCAERALEGVAEPVPYRPN